MSETVVKITNLVKEYKMYARKKDRLLETVFPWIERHGTFRAMNNLNLEIHKGEVLGILGKNGAGKSTLLKMITGVVIPTSGKIEIKGKISSLLELGTGFNPDLTGYENIYQHGAVMGLTHEQIKAKEQDIIDFADIGEHLNQPVKTYSSGMFARLAFACAINVDPEILIVDEALSVGDMAFQLKCFKKFEQFKEAGKTILFVTHSVSDVLRNCTRTIIIDSGTKICVEKYKKIIVGLNPDEVKEDEKINNEANKMPEENLMKDTEVWKDKFVQNPNITDYGDKRAEVIDYGMFDQAGMPTNAFDNADVVTLKSKIKFNTDVTDPIFTVTVKDFHGNDIAGTNTEIEKVLTGSFKKGDIAVCEFKQKIPVAAGKYTLSFSCTKYNLNGNLEVLNRKYDALLIEAITTKNTVGVIRLDSNIKVHKM